MQVKTISCNDSEMKLIRRNAFKMQCLAFHDISYATVTSKATNFKKEPFFDFKHIEVQYDKHPQARLYQLSEYQYILHVGTGDEVYKFATNCQLLPGYPTELQALPANELASSDK